MPVETALIGLKHLAQGSEIVFCDVLKPVRQALQFRQQRLDEFPYALAPGPKTACSLTGLIVHIRQHFKVFGDYILLCDSKRLLISERGSR
jgi:hypothetical protein